MLVIREVTQAAIDAEVKRQNISEKDMGVQRDAILANIAGYLENRFKAMAEEEEKRVISGLSDAELQAELDRVAREHHALMTKLEGPTDPITGLKLGPGLKQKVATLRQEYLKQAGAVSENMSIAALGAALKQADSVGLTDAVQELRQLEDEVNFNRFLLQALREEHTFRVRQFKIKVVNESEPALLKSLAKTLEVIDGVIPSYQGISDATERALMQAATASLMKLKAYQQRKGD